MHLLLSKTTRETLSRVEPVMRHGNHGWVFRDVSRLSRRYDLLGFSRETALWANLDNYGILDVREGFSAIVPAGHYGDRVSVEVSDLKLGLAALLDGLVRCEAGCIIHENCRESLLRSNGSHAIVCARGQIRWFAWQAEWRARRIESGPLVQKERRLRKDIQAHLLCVGPYRTKLPKPAAQLLSSTP